MIHPKPKGLLFLPPLLQLPLLGPLCHPPLLLPLFDPLCRPRLLPPQLPISKCLLWTKQPFTVRLSSLMIMMNDTLPFLHEIAIWIMTIEHQTPSTLPPDPITILPLRFDSIMNARAFHD